jgi:glycosyltransferase involved in cell wall biosynthesis
MKLSVIMPVFNEEATIEEILQQVRAVGLADEIIIVDDGSTDRTRELLKAQESQPGTIVIYHDRNQGKGAAVRTGFDRATGDILLIQDADLEYDPRDYALLIRPIVEGRVKVVYGSRFLGPRKAMMFWHMLGNKFLTLLTNVLYNAILSDMETCYKVFRADVIKGMPLHSRRFEFEPEIDLWIEIVSLHPSTHRAYAARSAVQVSLRSVEDALLAMTRDRSYAHRRVVCQARLGGYARGGGSAAATYCGSGSFACGAPHRSGAFAAALSARQRAILQRSARHRLSSLL